MKMRKRFALGLVLVSVGVIGILLISFIPRGMYNIDDALNIAKNYLTSLSNPDLAIDEIMEFEQNFYVIYYEKSTGIGAFEMLIDKYTGRIYSEYGPNMMWNTKYGHGGMMGGRRQPPAQQMPINQTRAMTISQNFLNSVYPGTAAEDSHPFYGYYTIHVEREGKVYGMLSVNGYDGGVWYHNRHGAFIQSREIG